MARKDTPRRSFAKTPGSCLTIEGSSPARRGPPPAAGSWRRFVNPQGQNMPQRLLPIAVAAALALPAAAQTSQPAAASAQQPTGERKVITSSDQLPRRQYQIPRAPSELLEAPAAELAPVIEALDRDLANDLATLDIRDRAARTGMMGARAQIAIHRGDLKAAQAILRDIRSQQEK